MDFTTSNTTYSIDYEGPIYDPTYHIELFHDSPRFGHTDDITNILKGGSDRTDYILGILFISLFCLTFFLLWSIAILLLKKYGTGWGWISGQTPPKGKSLRALFLIFAGLLVVSLTLLPAEGSVLLATTFYALRDGAKVSFKFLSVVWSNVVQCSAVQASTLIER